MKQYFKNIIFTKTPLKGFFRYKDEFQIYPLDLPHAPKSSAATHFPIILEYYTVTEENPNVTFSKYENVNKLISDTTNQANKLKEITNLLSALTNHRFFFYSHPEQYWTTPMPEEVTDEINNVSSSWSLIMFYYPTMGKELKITEFTIPKGNEVKYVPHRIYYWHDPIDSSEKYITFPFMINHALDAFYSLKERDKKVVSSAIYLLCNSLDLMDKMKSLSLLSAVSSIETLINHEYRKEKLDFECGSCKTLKSSSYNCVDCGRPIWGIAAKFRNFLKTYVSSSEEAIKKYKKIYNLRSKIAHTEYLLTGDSFIVWAESEEDKSEELFILKLESIQFARVGLTNWMIKKSQPTT